MTAKRRTSKGTDEDTPKVEDRARGPVAPTGGGGTLTDSGGRPVADDGGRIVNKDDPHAATLPAGEES